MAKHFIKRRKNRALEARKRPSCHLIAGKVVKLLSGSKKDHGIGPFARNAIDDRGVMGQPGFLNEQRQRPDPCIKGALDDALRFADEHAVGIVAPEPLAAFQLAVGHTRIRSQSLVAGSFGKL